MEWKYDDVMAANPDFKQADIDELKRWIQSSDSSSYIPKDMSEGLLLCFHNSCLWKLEDTKKCIKAYYSVREKAPEHFDDRDLTSDALKEAAKSVEYALLPTKTDEGYLLVYHGLKDFLPERYFFNNSCKMLFMTIDRLVVESGPVKGVILLFDMKGVKLGHLTRVNISSLAKFFTYIQDAMPLRAKKVIIMNVVSFFDKVMALMKPFMKKELLSLLSLYPPNVDYEMFYRDVLPKKHLPKDFGGDLPDVSTLSKKNMEKLISMKSFFEEEEKHRYIYNKKSKKKNKLDKGFQDLSID